MARCRVKGDTPSAHSGFPLLQLLMTPWLLSLHGIGRASGLQAASAICVLPLTTASMLPPARAGGIPATVAAEIASSVAYADIQPGPTTAADRAPRLQVTGEFPACPASARP